MRCTRTLLLAAFFAAILTPLTRAASSPAAAPAADSAGKSRPNVLLICIDDLRTELHCYGAQQMKTPNIDRLASEGRMFTHQYVAVPTCGASRYAMLTGIRPSKDHALGNMEFRRLQTGKTDVPMTLPHLFREHGYYTVCIGKISHAPDGHWYGYKDPVSPQLEMPDAWDEVGLPKGPWKTGWDAFFGYADGTSRTSRRMNHQKAVPNESADVPDTGYPDGLIAEAGIAKLKEFEKSGRPFFLALGFFRPHLPQACPSRYWDLYPTGEVKLSPCPEPPTDVNPKWALTNSGELWAYWHPKNAPQDPEYQRQLRRGYFAAVSYSDAQVGKVLAALDASGLSKNTIVVLWSDNGWHLGDLGMWAKHTMFDFSLHTPLIIRTPGMAQPGVPANGLVEALDIYPTLADLCGLKGPADLDGVSLRPILQDPGHPGLDAALSYYGIAGGAASIRDARYRLTYFHKQAGKPHAIELFDHQADPYEQHNVADQHPDIVKQLLAQLKADHPDWMK